MTQLLSPRELATLLSLSEQTIYNRHSAGGNLPPCIKIGNRLRFRLSDVDVWITSQTETISVPSAHFADARTSSLGRRGRPTKAEQIARRKASAKV